MIEFDQDTLDFIHAGLTWVLNELPPFISEARLLEGPTAVLCVFVNKDGCTARVKTTTREEAFRVFSETLPEARKILALLQADQDPVTSIRVFVIYEGEIYSFLQSIAGTQGVLN